MSTPSEVPCNWWTEWSGRVANRLLQPSNPTKLECWGDLIADILQWWDTNNHICALLKKKVGEICQSVALDRFYVSSLLLFLSFGQCERSERYSRVVADMASLLRFLCHCQTKTANVLKTPAVAAGTMHHKKGQQQEGYA
jgi:hypothetical protein